MREQEQELGGPRPSTSPVPQGWGACPAPTQSHPRHPAAPAALFPWERLQKSLPAALPAPATGLDESLQGDKEHILP